MIPFSRSTLNSTCLGVLLCHLICLAASAAPLHVWQGSPNPASPYTNWSTAARTIQEAVDAAQPGDTVLVTNGVYRSGGRAMHGTMTNRVTIDKAITVQSVEGPAVTLIEGAPAPGVGIGDGAIRGAYVGTNAVLNGFTLTNGYTRYSGDYYKEQSGGAVYSEISGIITNCHAYEEFGGQSVVVVCLGASSGTAP